MLIYHDLSIMSPEKTLLDLILDAMRKLELPPNQAFCRLPISVPPSNNRLRLRCITCADAHARLPLLPGCCDHGITRWIVGSKNSWRMPEVTAAKLLQLKSIEVQYRCWDTIIFYSQMKWFIVFS